MTPNELDTKWINRWGNQIILPKNSSNNDNKETFYMLTMFPYPSGMLHMGHLRVFTITDVVARYQRFQNKKVINPMGWDSFGLPAENAAIQRNVKPKDWTNENILKMKYQIRKMFGSFDWERELSTCDPKYYKFTQLIFLWLFKNGLAYKKYQEINWDPIDQTVLANEQVDSQGKSWRSGAIVEKKKLNQWFLKITDFANELNDDLNKLKDWPEKVKLMQKNWIGKSKGANIKFRLNNEEFIEVFTSRPETLFSVQYLAVSLDHFIIKKIVEENKTENHSLIKFINDSKLEEKNQSFNYDSIKSKKGHLIPNLFVVHPLSSEKVPIYVAPYVLGNYGSGAVMGCPGHDERDWEFWKENEPNKSIIKTVGSEVEDKPYLLKKGKLNKNVPKQYQDLGIKEAQNKIVNDLKALNLGSFTTNFKLRDWLISRQRYWGCPIPIIYCDSCGMVPVPENELPVKLPEQDVTFTGKGNPLDSNESFKDCKCPDCSKPAKRETDTMDTFMDSSWYYFRYLDVNNENLPFDKEKIKNNLPVKLYIGGIEHAILHLLYSRFLSKFLFKIGKWDGGGVENNGEPFKRLVSQGMVHGKTFVHPITKKFCKPDEINFEKNPICLHEKDSNGNDLIPQIKFEKMSKSKFNGVDPVEFIDKYGADATRAHMLFLAPVDMILYWDEEKISGIQRWLKKIENLSDKLMDGIKLNEIKSIDELLNKLNNYEIEKTNWNEKEIKFFNETQKYISSINLAFDKDLSLNTLISDYMKYTNLINSTEIDSNILLNGYLKLLITISPVCPATCEEIWEKLLIKFNFKWQSIFSTSWPVALEEKSSNLMKFMIMIDGKFKFNYLDEKNLINENQEVVLEKLLNSMEVDGKNKSLIEKIKNSIKKIIIKPKLIGFITK